VPVRPISNRDIPSGDRDPIWGDRVPHLQSMGWARSPKAPMKPRKCHMPFREDEPLGYIAREEWGIKMGRTHHQVQCPHCKVWHLWMPKLRVHLRRRKR
jgi:hypothetical protein